MPKTWSEKFNDPRPHQVKPCPVDISGMKKGEIMLIPSPKIVDAYIRTIPAGTSMNARELRAGLAKKHRAQVTCPITTGFHLRTVAEHAHAEHEAGKRDIAPVWRVLDADSPTLKKLSFGPFIRRMRRAEGLD
jgi:hypothetical protein